MMNQETENPDESRFPRHGDSLADRMRREAIQDRPIFSDALHESIMRQIDQKRRGRWRIGNFGLVSRIAAAIVILISAGLIIRWRSPDRLPLTPTDQHPTISEAQITPEARELAARLDQIFAPGKKPSVQIQITLAGLEQTEQSTSDSHPPSVSETLYNRAVPPEMQVLLALARQRQ